MKLRTPAPGRRRFPRSGLANALLTERVQGLVGHRARTRDNADRSSGGAMSPPDADVALAGLMMPGQSDQGVARREFLDETVISNRLVVAGCPR